MLKNEWAEAEAFCCRKLCNSKDSYHILNYVLRTVRFIHWVPLVLQSLVQKYVSLLIKVHALRQKPTYTHASSCPSCRRSWDSSAAGGEEEGGADRCGPSAASPSRSSLQSWGCWGWSSDSGEPGPGEEEEGWNCLSLAPSSKFGAPHWGPSHRL